MRDYKPGMPGTQTMGLVRPSTAMASALALALLCIIISPSRPAATKVARRTKWDEGE